MAGPGWASRRASTQRLDKLTEAERPLRSHHGDEHGLRASHGHRRRSVGCGQTARRFDNTLILFMSDNGGNAESGPTGDPRRPDAGELDVVLRASWAWMQNTPFRMYKHYTHEGGISTPLSRTGRRASTKGAEANSKSARPLNRYYGDRCRCGRGDLSQRPNQADGGRQFAPRVAGKEVKRGNMLFWEHEENRACATTNGNSSPKQTSRGNSTISTLTAASKPILPPKNRPAPKRWRRRGIRGPNAPTCCRSAAGATDPAAVGDGPTPEVKPRTSPSKAATP